MYAVLLKKVKAEASREENEELINARKKIMIVVVCYEQ